MDVTETLIEQVLTVWPWLIMVCGIGSFLMGGVAGVLFEKNRQLKRLMNT